MTTLKKRPQRLLRAAALLLVLCISLLPQAACGPAAAPTVTAQPSATLTAQPTEAPQPAATAVQPVALTDGLGRKVTLTPPAQRIISLAPSNTEILFAVGAEDQIVGRDEISDYPEAAQAIASIGSTYGELNTEAILALEPDLILGADITSPEQIAAMENLGLPVFVLANPTDFEGLFGNLTLAGEITGHAPEAEQLASELRGRVQAVEQSLQAADRPTVYYEVDGTDPTAPWTTGAGTFQSLLITMAGGQNVAEGIDGWGQISLEELVAQDPAVIIFGQGPWMSTTSEGLAARTGWGGLTAVQEGAVFGIDANWIDRPGPRMVDALEAMARFIHPELFP